jgi:hypothetical protein
VELTKNSKGKGVPPARASSESVPFPVMREYVKQLASYDSRESVSSDIGA